jgi:hypothetical protein
MDLIKLQNIFFIVFEIHFGQLLTKAYCYHFLKRDLGFNADYFYVIIVIHLSFFFPNLDINLLMNH